MEWPKAKLLEEPQGPEPGSQAYTRLALRNRGGVWIFK